MADGAPKSALEIALERLRKQDEAAGVVETPLTDAQRSAIAEARNLCEAKIAELKILHESKLATTWEPEARAKLDDEHRRDLDRLTGDRDRKIERIRTDTGG
jgi:hypothetical protein